MVPVLMGLWGEGKETVKVTNCDKFYGATEWGAEIEKVRSGGGGDLYLLGGLWKSNTTPASP